MAFSEFHSTGFASALLFNKVRYRAGKLAPEIDASAGVAISAVST